MGLGPGEVGSTLTEEELELVRSRFFFRPGFRLELAGSEGRVTRPPPGRIGVYIDALWAGLRFPFHKCVNDLLVEYQLVPAQLTPNSWRTIIGFASLWLAHGIPTSLSIFRRSFMLKTNPADVEWLYFAWRSGMSLFRGAPSSIHEWKGRFFFLSFELSWGFNPRWGHPGLKALNRLSGLSVDEQRAFDALRGLGRDILLTEFLTEEALVNVGLSSARPKGRAVVLLLHSSVFCLICSFSLFF